MSGNPFDSDIGKFGEYVYTNFDNILSAKYANNRMSDAIAAQTDYKGKTVIDIGCGDGKFTQEFIVLGAASVLGIDSAESAIKQASEKYKYIPNLRFECHDICTINPPERKFDIAVLRGVLHHIPDMPKGVKHACNLAKEIVVLEPNGYNPILKIIEKTSKYHIEHEEKSYFPHRLRKEFEKNGATLIRGEYVNLVPFFCPDGFAKLLNKVVPLVEAIPLVRNIACGQYVMHFKVS